MPSTPSRPPVDIQPGTDAAARREGWRSLQWWPTLAGIAFAAFVASDLLSGRERGNDLAPIVVASGLVYLGAAALERPSASWPVFFVSVLVITAAKLGWVGVDATWLLLAVAALLFVYGLLRAASRPNRRLALQAAAMLGFGAIAAVTIFVNESLGAFLVAGGLFGHAAWDAYHHWANKAVSRSMAEFCFVLDVLLAAVIVIVTVRS